MRCQSCDKNDATTTTVVCEGCQSYYASIREGDFREHELPLGEMRLRVTSWTGHAASPKLAKKPAIREEAAPAKAAPPKKRGFFGKKAAPEPELELEPPPDWKNRVFPSADPVPAAEASLELPAGGEHAVTHSEAEAFASGPKEFGYGLEAAAASPLPDLPGEVQPVELALEPPMTAPEQAMTTELPAALDLLPEAPLQAADSFWLATPVVNEAAAEAPAPDQAPTLHASSREPAGAQAPGLELTIPHEPVTLAPDDGPSSFFETPSAPEVAKAAEAPASEPPAEPAEPAASVELANFFESLAAPQPEPIEPEARQPAPEAAAPSELASFFESLSAPAPESAAPAPQAAPTELASFFESLGAPAPASAEPAQAAPEAVPQGLADFFSSLAAPAEAAPVVLPTPEPLPAAAASVAPPAEVPPPASEPVAEALPAFEQLQTPEPWQASTPTPASEPHQASLPTPASEPMPASMPKQAADPMAIFEPLQTSEPEAQLEPAPVSHSAAPAEPAATLAESAVSADLSDFFATLAVEPSPELVERLPALEAPLAPAAGALPASAADDAFFAALPPLAPEAAPGAAASEPAGIDLTSFFESLAVPAGPLRAPVSPPPVQPEAPGPVGQPLGQEEAAPKASVYPSEPKANPFSIAIDLPGQPAGAHGGAGHAPTQRPPTVGKPFSIELAPPTPAPEPWRNTAGDDMKRAHSMGALSFVGNEEEAEEATGFGLLDGLAFERKEAATELEPPSNSHAAARGYFNDDDDEKTIDL